MNTLFLLVILTFVATAEVHNWAVGNIDKEVVVTPDRVGVDENLALNWTGMPSIPVVARPPKPI